MELGLVVGRGLVDSNGRVVTLENFTQHLGSVVGVDLRNLIRTVVNTSTKEEYNTLMKVYESGGWRWADGSISTFNRGQWDDAKRNICVDAHDCFQYGLKGFYSKKNCRIISPNEFYDIEGILLQRVEEVVVLHDTIKTLLTKRS